MLANLFAWLAAGTPPHWQTAAIALVIAAPLACVSIANGLTKHYAEKKGLIRFLYFVADLFSVLASKGSPQTLKLPLTTSKLPGSDPPTFLPGGGLGGAS